MKTTILSLLLVCILPSIVLAQPMISTNEFYYVGDVIQMVECNPSGITAGSSGANIMWNFSTLGSSGNIFTETVTTDTSSVFLTSNLLINLSNGDQEYIQENSTDSYLNGLWDSVSGILTNYSNCDISKRPIAYLTNYTDTYRVSITAPATIGAGTITTIGDAYGTLVLPTGTYNNVLRVRKLQIENDTVGATPGVTTSTISYLWFDTLHNPPLLEIDSVTGVGGLSTDVMYLATSTGITNLNSVPNNYSCYMHGSELLLAGDFIYGKAYEVAVYNIIGTKIYSSEFTAEENSQRFDMDRQAIPGIYLVSITRKDDPQSSEVVKVLNQ